MTDYPRRYDEVILFKMGQPSAEGMVVSHHMGTSGEQLLDLRGHGSAYPITGDDAWTVVEHIKLFQLDEVTKVYPITARQIGFGVEQGYLPITRQEGIGYPRRFSIEDVKHIGYYAYLLESGIIPARAALLAKYATECVDHGPAVYTADHVTIIMYSPLPRWLQRDYQDA